MLAALLAAAALACQAGLAGQAVATPGDAVLADTVPGDAVSIESTTPSPRHTTAGRYLAGRFAENLRDLSSAAAFIAPVAGRDALTERAFQILVGSGRIEEAVAAARRLPDRDKGFVTPRLLLIANALGARRFGDAAEMLSGMPPDSFGNRLRPLVDAWVKMGLGKVDEALAALAALNADGSSRNVRILHEALINDLAGRADVADRIYRESFASAPPSRRFARFGAGFFLRQGRPEAAAALYASYLGTDIKNEMLHHEAGNLAGSIGGLPVVGSSAEGLAEGLFNLAVFLVSGNFLPPSLHLLRVALYLKPDFPAAQLMLGDLFQLFERNGEAVAAYRAIRPDTPHHWTGRLRAGVSLQREGQLLEARETLETMAAERSAAIQPLAVLGDVLRYAERFDAAAEAYDRAIERVSRTAPEHWLLFYHRGIAHERARHWEEAERDLLQALKLNPDDAYLLNYLAYSWVDRGVNLDRALEMLEKALKKQPNAGSIVDSMGWALYRLGRFEDAILHLERAAALRPVDSIILDHLGDAYWRAGRRNEARNQWHQALALGPEDERIPEIRAKIRDGLEVEPAGGSGG